MARDPAKPAISVVMATLNGAAFVRDQLDSVAAQTLLPDELLVGDEGSDDATVEIVERFAQAAPFPVHITRNPQRLGATENFLALSRRARGPLIALSDWDDVWELTKLERIAPWFDDSRVGLVVHRSIVVDEGLRPVGRRYPPFTRTEVRPARRVDPWLAVPGMGMVFRKGLLDAVASQGANRPTEAGGHPMDHDDWLYLLSGSLARTVLLAEDLTLYRQHGASYMGAPAGPAGERVDRALRLGAGDFQRQAAMFRARADFWSRVESDPATRAPVGRQASRSADWNLRLADLSDARAEVRDEAGGRGRRLARLLDLALAGGYRPRTMAGLGLRALAADGLGVLRGGSGVQSGPAPEALARRVAAARAAGRPPGDLVEELTDEGVPPLYGSRWSVEMIRDLVYQARRSTEDEIVRGAGESAAPSQAAPKRRRSRGS